MFTVRCKLSSVHYFLPVLPSAALTVLTALLLAATATARETPAPPVWTDSLHAPRAVLLDSGKVLFRNCAICHGINGRGGRGPTVANSDYVMADRTRLIRTVLDGVHDSIRVNGVRWKTGEMLGWGETWPDFKIAAVLTYIRAVLNDSLVVSCVPENFETGTWASCEKEARDSAAIAGDSIAVEDVTAQRAIPGLKPRH